MATKYGPHLKKLQSALFCEMGSLIHFCNRVLDENNDISCEHMLDCFSVLDREYEFYYKHWAKYMLSDFPTKTEFEMLRIRALHEIELNIIGGGLTYDLLKDFQDKGVRK